MGSPSGGSSMRRRLARIHRLGAVTVGVGLLAFGTVGLTTGVGFLSTEGESVAGMSSNGLLGVLSLVVGAVLVGAGLRGDGTASTVTAVVGGLFLLSGLGNLAVLDTDANLLAFEVSNVVFSEVVGILLVVLGLYGRVSGHLPPDNPYRMAREHRSERASVAGSARPPVGNADEDALIAAELAVAEGHPTSAQLALYLAEARRHADAEHRRAWEHYLRNHPEGW